MPGTLQVRYFSWTFFFSPRLLRRDYARITRLFQPTLNRTLPRLCFLGTAPVAVLCSRVQASRVNFVRTIQNTLVTFLLDCVLRVIVRQFLDSRFGTGLSVIDVVGAKSTIFG